jgi:hypothetical protein
MRSSAHSNKQQMTLGEGRTTVGGPGVGVPGVGMGGNPQRTASTSNLKCVFGTLP